MLLALVAPCQHYSLAGQEHGRTTPLGDIRQTYSITSSARTSSDEPNGEAEHPGDFAARAMLEVKKELMPPQDKKHPGCARSSDRL